ncbi:MAG: RHS repeat-associated core domain-containing protein [Chryseobacterium sp.]|nr:RHS repeat-associated core domain-containing protein [Chryseobacterium sp.]
MVYDKQNRLVATQDAELRKNNYWLYTKYDVWGRVALTGMSTGYGNSRISEQNLADALGQNNVGRTTQVSYNRQGIDVYYDNFNGSYPDSSRWITLLSVNYYDSYPGYPFNPPFPASIQGKTVLTETPGTDGKSTKGLPVLSLIKNIEDDNWTKNYVYYDDQGRAIGHYSINHLGGYTKTESKLDFAGLTQTSVVRHKRVDTDPERLITQNFEFDGQNRLLVHKHQIDSKPVEILAQNKYNELSQLESKKIGGTHIAAPLQTIEYQYNIQGSLTKVNNPADLNGKLFGYELKYQNPVYSNISPGKYSGNIMEMDWKDASENVLKRYTYSYDGLNRLKDAVYTEPNATNPYNNNYNESLIYDSNGNIKSLKRNAFPVMGTTSTLVDDLDYRYTGNLLTQVIENSLNDTGYEGGNNKIDYDLNGNMINMKDKGIYNIIYNFLNLPDSYSITQKDPLGATKTFGLEYLYSANGTKLRKIYTSSAGGRGQATTRNTTDYLDGFQYSISEIIQACDWCRTSVAFEQEAYKNAGIGIGIGGPETVTPEWVLNFVPTAEGFYNFTENRYIYQYKDHLGNARVSFTQNSAGALEITDTNSYYPLGLNHIGGNKGVLGSYQNYKYNGKELQETGMFDYGWRHYMPDLGRWTGMDQLSEKYYPTSPFAYADNNPIMIIDPDGRLNMHLINGFLSNSQSDVTWYNTGGGFSSTAGASVDYDGNTINWSHGYTTSILANVGVNLEYVNIPSIELKGSSFFWALKIQQHVNSYMERWNAKSDFEWDRMKIVARLNDHGVNYVGGAGDPIGIFDVVGQVMSTWKPENRYLAMAAGIIGAVALKKPGLAGAESKAVVNLTEETFSQALMKGAENVGGYSIYGTKGLVGNTFNRNIFLLEASGSKSLSGLRSLVGNMEKEALGTGANKISIYGSSVINKGFLNPNIAARFGYTFEQLGNGVVLQKTLK